jgi:hypothetical protein
VLIIALLTCIALLLPAMIPAFAHPAHCIFFFIFSS